MADSKTPACHCQAKLLPTAGEYIFGQQSCRGPLVVVLFMASTHIRMPAPPRNSPGTLFSREQVVTPYSIDFRGKLLKGCC